MTLTEWRVIGPPGTGKTTYVANKVAEAVRRVGPDSVCVASFTRAAAVEIGQKARGTIKPSHVGTLHSFALRQMEGTKLIYDIKDPLESWNAYGNLHLSSLEGDTSGDFEMDTPRVETMGDRCFADMERLRARRVPREAWPAHVREFAKQWDSWKYANAACDFTDLLEIGLEYVDAAPGRPEFFFLDEAQDLSALEMALARKWAAAAGNFIVVGDPDQALYRWRGADPEVFYSGSITSSRVLSQSYRVPKAVHAAATRWIERLPGRQPVEYLPTAEEGEVVRQQWSWMRPERLIEDACERMEEGKSAMVLASCDYMLRPLVAQLRKEGIPFHNPYRRKNGGWNPLGSKHGAKDRLLNFLRYDPEAWPGDARSWTAAEMHDWLDACEAKGLLKHGVKGQIATLAATPDAHTPLQLAHIERWFDDGVVADLEANAFQPQSLDWLASHLLKSKAKSFDFPLAVARRYGAARLKQPPRLTVGTVHSVKGGEADVVYLWPEISRQALQSWASGSSEGKADVRRMFYVGMTRARETLVLCGSTKSFMGVQWDA